MFVAESGLNAVGVLDAATGAVLGHVPTAWYPAQLAVSPDGATLFVSNAKGFGAGPNGGPAFRPGLRPDEDAAYIGRLMRGTGILAAAGPSPGPWRASPLRWG